MKLFLGLATGVLLVMNATAQITFSAGSLPHQVGDYCRAYYQYDADIASLLAGTNGPQQWDLSIGQQPGEAIERTDVISPADGGNAADFPGATYVERDTQEPDTQIAWRYYSLTNQGRFYHGYNAPVDNPVTPLVVFDAPSLAIPASVQFGQTWNRSVAWTNVLSETFLLAYHFDCAARVDAYGTLALPGIGLVPALRVKEIHSYKTTEIITDGSVVVDLHTNLYYYWLTSKIGVAAQINLFGNNALAPIPLPHTNLFERAFESNLATNQPARNPISTLRLQVTGSQAVLDWDTVPNASGYDVETNGSLNTTNWSLLVSPVTNTWSDPFAPTQRFYRVFWKP